MNYNHIKQKLRGSICPIITPFTEEGEIDEKTFKKLVDWQIDNGSIGISILGTSGEPNSLTISEKKQLMDLSVSAINGRAAFIPSTGTANTEDTLELTKYAKQIGADAVMLLSPFYVKPNQTSLYKYFKMIAEEVTIPIIIYNIPDRAAVNMEIMTMKRLAEDCSNIIGVKETNKDFGHISQVLLHCGREFMLFSGIGYPILAMGGAGYISAASNVVPDKVAQLYKAWDSGNNYKAIDLYYELLPLNNILFKESIPIVAKEALGIMGKINPTLRSPLGPPTKEIKQELARII